MRDIRSRWIIGALLLLLGTGSLEAQRNATVGGTILDENGEKLVGVVVTVSSPLETRSDSSNKKGRFRVIVMDATESFTVSYSAPVPTAVTFRAGTRSVPTDITDIPAVGLTLSQSGSPIAFQTARAGRNSPERTPYSPAYFSAAYDTCW